MNKENTGTLYAVLVCLVLIALILGTFFYVTFGNQEPEQNKEISVVLFYVGNGGWESFQEGIKRAEEDFSVNANFVILREDADAEEQYDAIKREVENGTEGIVVSVTDYVGLNNLMQEEPVEIPMVAVESGFNESTVPFISADNYEMGKKLGEEILKDFSGKADLTVALYSETLHRDSIERREQGLCDALDGKAKVIPLRAAVNGEDADVAVALHKEALQKLTKLENPTLSNIKKYGIGNSTSIVADLEQKKIEKLVFQNEFNMGYLAVEKLMEEIGSVKSSDRENIDCYCVSSEEIYDSPYEQLLFPIVK